MGATRKSGTVVGNMKIYCMAWLLLTSAWAVDPKFAEHLMGDTKGGGQGLTTMVDVDLDGDLDWLMASSAGTMFWEYGGTPGKPLWTMNNVGPDGKCETSAKAFDITGDGYPDQLSGANWLENPGKGGNIRGKWTVHTNNGVNVECADAILGDFNHDGRLDVAYVQSGQASTWYEIPKENPRGAWVPHVFPGVRIHSGLAAGDLNGDGLLDAVVAKTVFLSKNKNGSEWETLVLPVDADNCLVEIGDVDGDGDMDVIHQRHWGSSDNVWVENDGTGKNWTKHVVGKCETRGHSANIADIDNDGDPDFELGEDGGRSKWYLNEGNKTYRELVFTSKPTHDLRVGDVDRDGDLDMVAKPWGGGQHWYIENLVVDQGGPKKDWRRGPMGSHNPANPNRPRKPGCMDPNSGNFDFWAFHDGPINQGCTGTGLIAMRPEPRAARQAWVYSLSPSVLDGDSPIFRLDGSRLLAVEAAQPTWGLVVGKRRTEGGVR